MGEQHFWEQLKQKYEEKNRTLQQKEQELRLRLEAMDTIIGDTKTNNCMPPQFSSPTPNEIHSCDCDKPGFLKALFSLFSSKPKGPVSCTCSAPPPVVLPPRTPEPQLNSPRAPQDVPTKDRIKDPGPNLSCQCSVCVLDTLNEEDMCNCSVCSKINLGDGPRKVCPCDLALADTPCPCNFEQNDLGGVLDVPAKPKRPSPLLPSPSKLSLKSIDLHYMKNIHDLASQQKDLISHIDDLEKKAKIYEDVFAEYKNVDFASKDCKCVDQTPDPNEKNNAELKLENFLLKNELKDMRLEVRQYLERMEGPMQFKIESEKYKRVQLEQKLEEADKELRKVQDFYQKEINELKMKLFSANTEMYKLNATCDKFKQELEACQKKCVKLEDDIIRQKISEADTIRSLQAALNARGDCAPKDECELHNIARELSKILKECEPCGECVNLPDDLTAAAKLLKSLTDMVDVKVNRADDQKVEATSNASKVGNLQIVSKQEINRGDETQETAVSMTNAISVSSKPAVTTSEAPDEDVPAVIFAAPPVDEQLPVEEHLPSEEHLPTEQQLPEPEAVPSGKINAEPENVRFEEDIEKVMEPLPPPVTRSSLTPKSSCCCLTPRSKDVDQLWPKTDKPVELKDSEIIDTPVPSKKSCSCSVAKSLKEKGSQPRTGKSSASSRKDLCKCDPKSAVEISEAKQSLSTTERFKLSHQVTASKSKEILKSETNVQCLEVKENFPFTVDTKVDVLNKPPEGVHVTTTITDSGTLEVITEGPEGVIETTLVYTKSGNVEVVTEILQYSGKDKLCKRVKGPKQKAIEAPKTSASEPAISNSECMCDEFSDALKDLPPCDPAPEEPQIDPAPEEPQIGPADNPNCMCDVCPDPFRGLDPPQGTQPDAGRSSPDSAKIGSAVAVSDPQHVGSNIGGAVAASDPQPVEPEVTTRVSFSAGADLQPQDGNQDT